MYEILLSREAVKYYQKQADDLKSRLNKAIDSLSSEPIKNPQVKKLHGQFEGNYRLRVGEIRIVYEIDHKSKIVRIKAIKSRENAYKR
ncbi:MAG: type II toxin-antitoxin system RelE/ParE family toxin [Candidatus Wallbacteria bacterium]|nr:type II toxin-antitoxin system RelE/ParE family toxin [Candidatus Wallbacteria bacterium]